MTVHSVTIGAGDTPALMLHCALASHQAIVPLARLFPGLTSTCMDLLGHGMNQPPDRPNSLAANAAAAADLWTGPGWVTGHSYGAAVAIRFALDHPDRVTHLVLIEPVLFAAASHAAGYAQFRKDFIPIGEAFAANDMDRAAQHFIALWGDGTPWADVPKPLRDYAVHRMDFIAQSAADLEEDQSGMCAAGVLEELNIPVTLIRGATSHPVIADVHDKLAECLPNATQHVVAGAGHMAPITHTADVADIIKAKTQSLLR